MSDVDDVEFFSREDGDIIVTIVKCEDLFDADQKSSGLFGSMSSDDIDPYVEIRPSWLPADSSKSSSKTKSLNGAGRNPNFLEKLQSKATLTFKFVKGDIKDDEDVKLFITVNDANMLSKPAFIGNCEWTIPNKVFRYKATKDAKPLTFTETLSIKTKKKKLTKKYKKYFKSVEHLSEQRLGTISFEVKYKSAGKNRGGASKGGQTSRSKGSPRKSSLSPRKSGRKKNKEEAKKFAELSPDDILHFIQEELAKNGTNLQEWLGQYDKDGDGSMKVSELHNALTSYDNTTESEDEVEPQTWGLGFEKNDPRFKKLLTRFDLKDSTHNPNGKKKMVSITNIIETATGKLLSGSGTQILLSALREKLGDDLHDAKSAENGSVMEFFETIVEDDEDDAGKDVFERAIDKPHELIDFKKKIREFVTSSTEKDIQVKWEKRNHIEWPHHYDDLLIFFDTDGDKKIILKEFANVLTKGMAEAVEERKKEAENDSVKKASKPLPLNDDDIPVAMPGILEIKCVSGESLRNTASWRDKEMDPYVKVKAPWHTQKKCTKAATNMHTEPRWLESHNNILSFEVTETHISAGQPLSAVTVTVHDEKSLAIDPLVGTSTLNIERFLTSKNLANKWKRMRTELSHKDGSSSGTLNLEIRFVPKEGIIIESEVEEKKVGGKIQDTSETKMLCPGVFAIRVTGGVKEGMKEVTNDSHFKLGIIPQWAGRRGLQEPEYPKKKSKKGSQKKHFSFPGALGDEAYNQTIDNIGFRIEIADLSGYVPGFKTYKLKYYGTITKKQIMDIKKYKDRLTSPYKPIIGKDGETKKEVEELTTIEVTLTEGSKNKKSKNESKKITMMVAIDFQQTSEQPLKEEELGTSSEGFDGEPPSTTGILQVELVESRNVSDADWFSGSSDPYVKLQMAPFNKNANKTTKRLEKCKTLVYKNAGATVQINETFQFPMFSSSLPDYKPGKGKERAGNLKLRMEMKDSDIVRDDTLGVCALDVNQYLKAGVKGLVTKPGHTNFYKSLKSTDDENKIKTTMWYNINFIPAEKLLKNALEVHEKDNKGSVGMNDAIVQCLRQRTGKCQILVMDAKKLVNVEGMLRGKQDPYVDIRIIAEDDKNYNKDRHNESKWDGTSYKDGAGRNPFWHEWLELNWDEEMKNTDISTLSFLVVVWDKNILTSTLIGAAKIPLMELLTNPGGKFFNIFSGKTIDSALADKKVDGQVRLAAHFVPDPKALEVVKAAPIKKGSFSFYAGSVSCSDIISVKKTKDTTIDFKVVITDLSKAKEQDPSIETSSVNTAIKCSGIFHLKRKFDKDIEYSVDKKNECSSKFQIDLVAEKTKEIVASAVIPSDVLYSAFKVSKQIGNNIVKKWIPLTSNTEKKTKFAIVKSRVELAWVFKDDEIVGDEANSNGDPLSTFFDDETSILKPCCKPGTLKVRVLNATNLLGNELFTKSDPFPTALLLPDNETKKFDYPHMDGMPNPIWNWKDKTPAQWDFLVEDATIASLVLQVSNFNEAKKTYGDDIMAHSTVSIGTKLFEDGNFEGLKTGEKLNIPVTAKYPLTRYGTAFYQSALKDSYITAEMWFEEEGDGKFTNGYIPPKAGTIGRPIDLLEPPDEELLALEGMVFCKPVQTLSLTNVDSDGKNDIKVVCELFIGAGEHTPVEEGETNPVDSAGESHEFDSSEIIGINYKSEYLKIATSNASTPYVRIKVVDIDEKKKKDTLIGRVDIPLYSLLQNEGAVYCRKLTLMDEDCVGNRGKLEVMLQFVKDFDGDKKTYTITEEMIKSNSRQPIPGTIDFHIKSGRELQMTTKETRKNELPAYKSKPLKDIADPYVILCLKRGGYNSDHNQSDEPDQAIHTTYEHQDGGATPAWDEPPGILTSHDIELDMLHVVGMYKDRKKAKIIGSFDVSLAEFAMLNTEIKKLEGWFPLMYEGQRNTSSVRMALTYTESDPEDKEADKVILSNNAPKGFISGKGMLDVTVVAARGIKTKKKKGVDYFVRCKIIAADGALNLKKLPGGQFETPVDEHVASGDQAVFNHRQKIDISWKREDISLPVMKVSLQRKSGGSEGTCQVDLAPFIQAPGQPAEFWMEIKKGIDVKLAIRFDDHKRELDKTDTKYFKKAIQGIRNFNTWGSVSVMVVKLRKLKDVGGFIGKLSGDGNDPYVTARLYGAGLGMEGVEDKTRSKTNGRSNARLNETMLFSVDNRQITPGSVTSLMLETKVYDYDKYSKDDLIGTVTIPIMPFQVFGGHMWEDWFPIRYGKNYELAGEVQLVMQWLPEGASSGMKFKLGGDKPLWIHLKKALQLKDVTKTFSTDYKMDPFVRIEIVNQDTRVDSDIAVDEGSTPTWDSYIPIDVSDGETTPEIKFSVYDNNGKSNALIGWAQIPLLSNVMEPMASIKSTDAGSDPLRKDLVEYQVVEETLELQNNEKPAGKLLIALRREEFEGITGRDDGQNRGAGDTTVEEDFGEDEDDDGEADGRLHIDLLNLKDFEDSDHFIQNNAFKMRVCINPAKKYKKTKESFKLDLDSSTKKWMFDTSKNVTTKKQKNKKNFQFVLPYMANVGNASAILDETNVKIELVVPGGMFNREKVFAIGTIPWEVLDPLEPRKNEEKFPPKPPVEYDVPLNIVKDNKTITLGIAKVKLTYISFVAGKVKVGVSKGHSLQLAGFKDKKPRVQMIPVINGKEITSEKKDMQPKEPSNGKDAEKGNPEWTNPQMTLRYTNGNQKQPDYLKIKVVNVPNKFVGEILVPFYDILRNTVGGKMILEGVTLNNEKGKPTNGKIDAEIIFYIDGKAAIAKTTAKEEKEIVETAKKHNEGKNVEVSEEIKNRKKDADKLMHLRDMFYKIDKDNSHSISTDELKAVIMNSASDNKEIFEFLQKAWKAYQKEQNNRAKNDPEQKYAPKDYSADNVVDMIEGVGGDNTITWDEWVSFAERNIVAQRKAAEEKNKIKAGGDGVFAKQKKKMLALGKMMDKFEDAEAEAERRRLAMINTEKKRKKAEARKRALEEKKRLEAEREAALQSKREHDKAMQESKNMELELELKMAKYREEQRLAREMAAAEKEKKEEAKRLAEEKRKRKLQRNKIKYVDLPEKQVMHWKPYHVEKWIRTKLDLPQYASRFSEASVDGLLLLSLTESDMKEEELNVDKKLHRAKIFVHIMRLREMAGLPQNDFSRDNSKVNTSNKKKGGRSVIQIGKSGGAGIAAAPELMRLKLKKFTNRVEAQVQKENAEDKEADAVWPFQYDNPANVELVTEVNMWDFDNDWADQFQEDDPFSREIIDDEDEPPEEAQFRRAMTNVWKKDAEMAKQHGWTVATEEAFGDDAPGAGKSAKADPYAFIMKFAKDNQLSFYEAVEEPEIKKLNLKLKTGDSIYAQTEAARETRQLPPEFWFKNKTPWWMKIDEENLEDGSEGGTKPKARKRRTKIPNLATTEEVLAVVRQAVLEYGRNLESHRKKNMPKEQFEEDMKTRRLKIKKLRSKQGLPDLEPMAEEEDRLLADVFTAFSNLQNNETVRHGKSGSWTGFHDKLNRLKLQGAIKVLLKLDMNWQQFDAFFRTLSTNHDGTLQQDEFVAAFRSKGQLSDLLRNDKAGEASRRGGRRRRHNHNLSREEGYHGMGAKKGDEDWRQILDALYGVLRTLEESNINLREAFESFDRNASGEISVAEFASLMKTLGGFGLTKRQIYHLINMMDANFDRTVRYNEFMEFFLVVWVGRLKELRNNLRLHKKGAPDDGSLDYGHQLTESQIKRRLIKAEHAIKATFGSGFMAAAKTAGAVLPGAFSALMNKMGLETNAIKSSFMPTDKSGKQLVEEAREMTLSPDGRRYKRQFEAELLANKTITAPKQRKKTGKRVNIKETNRQIAGKHTLAQMSMSKAQKRASGELNGPRFKSYGKNGDRELGMGTRKNLLDEFPSDYISKNPS